MLTPFALFSERQQSKSKVESSTYKVSPTNKHSDSNVKRCENQFNVNNLDYEHGILNGNCCENHANQQDNQNENAQFQSENVFTHTERRLLLTEEEAKYSSNLNTNQQQHLLSPSKQDDNNIEELVEAQKITFIYNNKQNNLNKGSMDKTSLEQIKSSFLKYNTQVQTENSNLIFVINQEQGDNIKEEELKVFEENQMTFEQITNEYKTLKKFQTYNASIKQEIVYDLELEKQLQEIESEIQVKGGDESEGEVDYQEIQEEEIDQKEENDLKDKRGIGQSCRSKAELIMKSNHNYSAVEVIQASDDHNQIILEEDIIKVFSQEMSKINNENLSVHVDGGTITDVRKQKLLSLDQQHFIGNAIRTQENTSKNIGNNEIQMLKPLKMSNNVNGQESCSFTFENFESALESEPRKKSERILNKNNSQQKRTPTQKLSQFQKPPLRDKSEYNLKFKFQIKDKLSDMHQQEISVERAKSDQFLELMALRQDPRRKQISNNQLLIAKQNTVEEQSKHKSQAQKRWLKLGNVIKTISALQKQQTKVLQDPDDILNEIKNYTA